MQRLIHSIRRFLYGDDGPTAVEYCVMLALIILVCILAIGTIGTHTSSNFSKMASSI